MAELDQLSTLAELSVSAKSTLTSFIETTSDNFEGDIPELSEMPTLDSILGEDNEAPPTIDELGLSDIVTDDRTADETHSNKELDTNISLGKPSKKYTNTILRQDRLTGIANQITKPNIRSAAGYPTAMTVGLYYLIGTSHGLVLWFDGNERLVNVLTPKQQQSKSSYEAGQYGAVSSLDISADGTRLLVGHAKGLITHWDLEYQKLLRFIDDAHPPGHAVLNIRFTDDPTVSLFSDTGGNVYFLKFRRNFTGIRTWSSECFFSGCNGEAFTFEPVKIGNIPNHPLKDHCIIAIATVTQLIILSVAPKLEGLVSMPMPGNATSLPLLAWEFAIVEDVNKDKHKYPVLAVIRDDIVHYLQLSCENSSPTFKLLKKVKVQYQVAAFKWINSQLVVAMDTTERIHLINIRENLEIEVLDLKDVELVYGTSFYKSIETGGNVSRALEVASEHACYNSVLSRKNQLLLLGLNSLNVITIKSWKERLASLVRDGQFVEAINLALDIHEGKAQAVVGLPSQLKKRKDAIMEQVVDTLLAFVDIKLLVNKPKITQENDLKQYYKAICKVAFDSCVRIKNFDILFGTIYDTFSGEGQLTKQVFLEMLFDYVTDRKIHTVKSVVVKELIDLYRKKGDKRDLEACILGVNPLYVDMHHVIEMCWSEHLYDAMIHVYNNGLLDYTTPLLELLLQLRSAIRKKKSLPEHFQKIGHTLLVYIRCCLSGLAYPTGYIPSNRVLLAKSSVYETLLIRQNTHDPSDTVPYPHIRTLLEFDTREFMNVLSFAFEEKDFDQVQAGNNLPGIPTRQLIIDILIKVMITDKLTHFTPSQVGSLFTFLARQGAKHRSSIRVDSDIYDQVLTYFTKTDEDVVNEERQQAVLELWDCGVLQKFDEERLLVMADSARFYRLCELLYQKRRQYGKVLMCYFKDPHRIHQSFSYIHQLMTDDQYTEPDREECTATVLSNIEALLNTDVKGTSQLILMDFPLELAEVTYKLDNKTEMQFEFLKGIFDPKSASKQEISAPSHVAERYIELLCLYQPKGVYSFLKTNECYRLEEALDICAMAKLVDATAYLLERTGDVKGAFKLTLDTLETELIKFGNKYRTAIGVSTEFADDLNQVNTVLIVLLQLCQRNSVKVDEKSRQSLWLPVFDMVLSMPNKYSKSTNSDLKETFKTLIADVLDSMMGYINLPDILQKIIEDPSYESGQFTDIKPIVVGMLDTYNYEEVLLKTTNHIFVHDVKYALSNLHHLSHRATSSGYDTCALCDRTVSQDTNEGIVDDVILFSCGHVYHCNCIGISSQSATVIGLSCQLCDKSSKPSLSHQNRLITTKQDGKLTSGGRKQNKEDSIKLDHNQLLRLQLLNKTYSNASEEVSMFTSLHLAPPRIEGAHV